MTFAAADPVSSGRPYPVLTVDDRAPSSTADFVGLRTVVIDCDGRKQVLNGVGAERGGVVRFHEKDAATDKDVRLWRVGSSTTSGFVAETVATGQA